MRLISILVISLFVLTIQPLYAHPPSNITLTYDAKSQNLHVDITHVSHNLNKHRIRLLTIYKNGQEVNSYPYATQTKPNKVIQDVPLSANPGESISIKAICSEGGIGTQELVIPKISRQEKKAAENKKKD